MSDLLSHDVLVISQKAKVIEMMDDDRVFDEATSNRPTSSGSAAPPTIQSTVPPFPKPRPCDVQRLVGDIYDGDPIETHPEQVIHESRGTPRRYRPRSADCLQPPLVPG